MTFPQSTFPRTEFDGEIPCSNFRRDRPYKSIGLPRCERCDTWTCTLPYYRWEQQRNAEWSEHRDCFVHSPPRDFPALRAEPLWQQTWVQHGRSFHRGDSGFAHWFPPLRCGPNAFGDVRKKLIGFTTSNYRRASTQLCRIYSSPGCRCDECLANAQTIEIMLVGVAAEIAQWPDTWEHRCWFGPAREFCLACWTIRRSNLQHEFDKLHHSTQSWRDMNRDANEGWRVGSHDDYTFPGQIELSQVDLQAFENSIADPAEPNEALKSLFNA